MNEIFDQDNPLKTLREQRTPDGKNLPTSNLPLRQDNDARVNIAASKDTKKKKKSDVKRILNPKTTTIVSWDVLYVLIL